MPEAITKYAVNSTLGTDEFEPLDKIIKGQRTYAASDDLLVILAQNLGTVPKDFSIIENACFKSKVNGSIRVSFFVESISNADYTTFHVNIYKDDSIILGEYDFKIPPRAAEYVSLDIPIEKASKYTFYTKQSRANASSTALQLDEMRLCGRIVDISMLEIGGDE